MTDYGPHQYISMVGQGKVVAVQFHPEKSGPVGLAMIRSFLARQLPGNVCEALVRSPLTPVLVSAFPALPRTELSKRIVACLDVRTNDEGDLVVTKGDQYDVRETQEPSASGRGGVRNLGKPVALCQRYYEDGADEVSVSVGVCICIYVEVVGWICVCLPLSL